MSYSRFLAFLGIIALLATAAEAISIKEIDVSPSNQLYLDDSFSVRVHLAGNSCGCKARFYMDDKRFNTTELTNGTKPLKCDMTEVDSGVWNLLKSPLSAGTHVLKIELVESGTTIAETTTMILRIFDLERPKVATTTTRVTTTRRTTTTRATTSTTSTTLLKSYISYDNPVYAFELSYPDTWEKTENDGRTVVSFSAPLENLGVIPDIYQENISVSVVKVASDVTVDSFTQKLEDSLRSAPNFKKKGSSDADLSGQPAHQLIYEFRRAPINMRVQMVYTKRNDIMYVLAYEAEDVSYAKYLPDFNRMRDSFWINLPSTTTTSTTTTTTTSTTLSNAILPANIDLTPAALVVVAIFAVILFFSFRGRPEKKPKVAPPAPPRPAPASPPNELMHEEVKNEVMRRTAAVITEEHKPLPKADKPLIEDVKDPAYERLKRIKALEHEVEEVIKREKTVKAAADRMKSSLSGEQPSAPTAPKPQTAEPVHRTPVEAPKPRVEEAPKPAAREALKPTAAVYVPRKPVDAASPKPVAIEMPKKSAPPVPEAGEWQVLKQPLKEAPPKKPVKEASQKPAEDEKPKKSAKAKGKKKDNGSG